MMAKMHRCCLFPASCCCRPSLMTAAPLQGAAHKSSAIQLYVTVVSAELTPVGIMTKPVRIAPQALPVAAGVVQQQLLQLLPKWWFCCCWCSPPGCHGKAAGLVQSQRQGAGLDPGSRALNRHSQRLNFGVGVLNHWLPCPGAVCSSAYRLSSDVPPPASTASPQQPVLACRVQSRTCASVGGASSCASAPPRADAVAVVAGGGTQGAEL